MTYTDRWWAAITAEAGSRARIRKRRQHVFGFRTVTEEWTYEIHDAWPQGWSHPCMNHYESRRAVARDTDLNDRTRYRGWVARCD